MVGPAHGASTGGYIFWVFTVIVLVFATLTLSSGKFYPPLQTRVRPIERQKQPGLYWLMVALMLAATMIFVSAAIWIDRRSTISW